MLLPCLIQGVHNGEMTDEEWPAMFDKRHIRPDDMHIDDLLAVWEGRKDDEYAVASVVGTVAVSLYMMGRAASREEAEKQAWAMWERRNTSRFNQAA